MISMGMAINLYVQKQGAGWIWLPWTWRRTPGCGQAGPGPLLFVMEGFGSHLHPPIEKHITCGIHARDATAINPGTSQNQSEEWREQVTEGNSR